MTGLLPSYFGEDFYQLFSLKLKNYTYKREKVYNVTKHCAK